MKVWCLKKSPNLLKMFTITQTMYFPIFKYYYPDQITILSWSDYNKIKGWNFYFTSETKTQKIAKKLHISLIPILCQIITDLVYQIHTFLIWKW